MSTERFRRSCPRQLNSPPDAICKQGLERAQWTRDNVGYLSFEEKTAPGCPWGILSDDADCYCFFKLMQNKDGQVFTEEEIAYRLGLSKQQIAQSMERAIQKLKDTEAIKDIAELHRQGGLFTGYEEVDNSIYFPDGLGADEAGPTEDTPDAEPTRKRGRGKVKPLVVSPD